MLSDFLCVGSTQGLTTVILSIFFNGIILPTLRAGGLWQERRLPLTVFVHVGQCPFGCLYALNMIQISSIMPLVTESNAACRAGQRQAVTYSPTLCRDTAVIKVRHLYHAAELAQEE